MKKKQLAILVILVVFVLMLALAGCNNIKLNKDYHLYSFAFEKGTMAEGSARYSFTKKGYEQFSRFSALLATGEYVKKGSAITLIPDKIGDGNRMVATRSLFLDGKYIIDPTAATIITERVEPIRFQKTDSLEGMYDMGLYLKGGKIYTSTDNSDTPDSYTELVGEYAKNKRKKEFIEVMFYRDLTDTPIQAGEKMVLLHFKFTNEFGENTSALTSEFYATKLPRIKKVKSSLIELDTRIFKDNSAANGGMGKYDLKLINFPDKKAFNKGVTFEIADDNGTDATISGNTLRLQGTGTVTIRYKYNKIVAEEDVYIVGLSLKDGLTAGAKTYSVGDKETFATVINKLATYSPGARLSIELPSSTNLVQIMDGKIHFLSDGTVTVRLVARYVDSLADGTQLVRNLTVEVDLIIEA